jgi:thioredoxin 1
MLLKNWIVIIFVLVVSISGCLTGESNTPEAGKISLGGLELNTTLEPSLQVAKTQGKPVFVYLRSESCGWCKKFEAETFTNQSVINILNEDFVLISIDVFKQENETRNFRVRSTPTEIFLDSNGTEIKRIPGYVDNQTFLDTINDIANLRRGKNNEA